MRAMVPGRRSITRPVALGCAFVTLLAVGCGGASLSDKGRRERAAAVNAANEDDEDPTLPSEQAEAGSTPTSAADAGSSLPPPAAIPDAAPVIPAGSYGVGTELETTTGLNLREGPGTEFAVIVVIPIATRVKVEKTSGADGWVNISYNAMVGFASKDFLKVVP
jgi:hypothetical protein